MASNNNDGSQQYPADMSSKNGPAVVVHEPTSSQQYTEQQQQQQPSPSSPSRPRPISTIAQSFATDLDSMFGLTSSTAESGSSAGVDALSLTVEEKKKNVSSGQSELEALEARLRATEQRLAKVSRQSSPARPPGAAAAAAAASTGATMDVDPAEAHSEAVAARLQQEQEKLNQGQGQGQQGAREDFVMVDRGATR